MDRKVAEQIVPILLSAAQDITDTVELLRVHAGEPEVKPYSQAVGKVMFALDDLLRPIWSEHPDLRPWTRP
jgi:hypothetical protein